LHAGCDVCFIHKRLASICIVTALSQILTSSELIFKGGFINFVADHCFILSAYRQQQNVFRVLFVPFLQ